MRIIPFLIVLAVIFSAGMATAFDVPKIDGPLGKTDAGDSEGNSFTESLRESAKNDYVGGKIFELPPSNEPEPEVQIVVVCNNCTTIITFSENCNITLSGEGAVPARIVGSP